MKHIITLPELIRSGTLRCICCDWDDTLFAWSNVLEDDSEEWKTSMLHDIDYYANHPELIGPVDFMQVFCRLMADSDDIKHMFVLTLGHDTACLPAKIRQVCCHYENVFNNVYMVSSFEHKIIMMDHICNAFGYTPEQVLLVDDRTDTCLIARSKGYYSTTPLAIYQYLNAIGVMPAVPVEQDYPM